MDVLEDGQKFERYRIIRMLGKSNTGISYEAEDSKLQRHVTLKLIQPWSLLPDSTRRQFFRDLHILSGLSHPLLTTILNYGEFNGRLYIARYFVEYGSLQDYPGRLWFHPPLDVTMAITYIRQVAAALSYTHKYGYSHGSLSFTNILAIHPPQSSRNAPFMISDTGLGSYIQRALPSSTTPPAMTTAPAQSRNRLTPASDQYSLATLLYFWLSGHLPFMETTSGIAYQRPPESLLSLCSLNPHVTPSQEHVIDKALNSDPQERYASIDEFITELTAPRHYNSMTMPSSVVSTPVEQQSSTPIQTQPEIDIAAHQHHHDSSEVQQTLPPTASLHIHVPHQLETLVYQLHQQETTLGHAGDSDILLDQDERTSRHHALIKYIHNHYFITDCKSTQGIYIDNHKLSTEEDYCLQDGDTIDIAGYTLTFHNEHQ